jgi:Spy/CpxP family protein refolding chaperone
MKSLVQKLCLVGLAVMIALPIAAQDKKEKKNGKKGGGNNPIGQLKKQLEDANLTAEQQKKVDEIVAKHETAIKEAAKKAGDAPRRLADARKKFQGEKKGKELKEAARAEAKLTSDEQAAVDDLDKHLNQAREEIAAVLTQEQKEKTKIGLGKGKKNK